MPSGMFIRDGVIKWFDGPEWDDVVQRVFQGNVSVLETVARSNAPWEDRTGDARAGLTAKATSDGKGEVSLTLYHTVSYGKWLETIQSGRFGIIQQTLEENAQAIFNQAIREVQKARKGTRF